MSLTRTQQVVVAFCIACIVGAVAVGVHGRRARARPTADSPIYSPPVQPPVPATITVHVAGAVQSPGLKVLPRGARVNDAVLAAGGWAAGADLSRVNLAAPLDDGERVDIPFASPQAPSTPAATTTQPNPSAGPARPVNINTATAEELHQLPGIGPALAQKIIAYRRQAGGFRSVDDLAAVPGIGPKRLSEIRPFITVQ